MSRKRRVAYTNTFCVGLVQLLMVHVGKFPLQSAEREAGQLEPRENLAQLLAIIKSSRMHVRCLAT